MCNDSNMCRMCNTSTDLVKSHVFSNLLYKPVYGKHGQYNVLDPENNKRLKEQGGLKGLLLCKDCETKRSRWENYAKYFLFDKRATKWERVYPNMYKVTDIDYNRLKLFVLSTLWMVSVADNLKRAQSCSLGRHEENIRQMLFSEAPGPAEKYGVMLRKIKENIGDKLMLADAIKQRMEGHNCYYMVFGGYAWYVLVTSHKLNSTIRLALLNESGSALVNLIALKEIGILDAVKLTRSAQQ